MPAFPSVHVSGHAVDRWIERVDRAASRTQARLAVASLVATGKSRPNPRSWMRESRPAPGARFVYSANYPGVCAIVRGCAVLTIVTRGLFRVNRGSERHAARRVKRATLKPVPPFRWDGDLEEAA
jgi:hypothetical protein